MTEFKFKTEWLDLLFMVSADDDCNIQTVLEAIKLFVTDGVLPDYDKEEYYLLTSGTQYALNLILRGIQSQQAEEDAKRKAISEKRAAAGRAGAMQMQANASKCQQMLTNVSKEEREDETEKKEVSPIPPLERKEREEEKEGVAPSFDISDEISHFGACAEQTESDSAPTEPPILTFPLAKGKTFAVTQSIFDMLAECYPAVNTMEELRRVKAWSESNPKRRKVDGKRFLNNWFSKQQDRGPRTGGYNDRPHRPTPEETYSLPAINPWALPEEVAR